MPIGPARRRQQQRSEAHPIARRPSDDRADLLDTGPGEGDSGGPLTNRSRPLIGIDTIGSTVAEDIGFAIAKDQPAPILKRLRSETVTGVETGRPQARGFT